MYLFALRFITKAIQMASIISSLFNMDYSSPRIRAAVNLSETIEFRRINLPSLGELFQA